MVPLIDPGETIDSFGAPRLPDAVANVNRMPERPDRREGLRTRRDEIVRALVEEHIRTGEPVSSRAIVETSGLGVSAATIRSELAALERDGYAVQPHTSAGRVPTARAYRYYVDHLSASELHSGSRRRIGRLSPSVQLELGKLVKATTELLAEMTHYPAVAVTAAPSGDVVRAVHLVQLGTTTALLVVITGSGRVYQDVCAFPAPVSPADVEQAETLLLRAVVGTDLGAMPGMGDVEVSPTVGSIVETALAALTQTSRDAAEVYVGGMTAMWSNLSAVQRVLEVLERKAILLELLAVKSGMSVRIGEELPVPDDVELAVVSSSFEAGAAEGRLGVIGPMRMDYKRVMSAVDEVTRELGNRFGS